jgi:hypothetical protein
MLLLGRGAQQIEGITIYPDHENDKQFWYLSGSVQLAKRDDKYALTLIKYNQSVGEEGVKGGGFATFEVNIGLSESQAKKIHSKLPKDAVLAAVPFNQGTVKCVALNVGKESIVGASSPSLFGDNAALFSLTLDKTQTAILESAFSNNGQPIGVYYDLEFTAMRPSLDVKLEADLARVYTEFQFSLGVEATIPAGDVPVDLEASIDAGFQKLVQEGAIKIEVFSFSDDADVKRQKDEAVKFFMDQLLKDWFTPTFQVPKAPDDKSNQPTKPKPEEKPTQPTETNPEEKPTQPTEANDDNIVETLEDVIPQVKLKLRFVHQEEQKKVTYRYSGSQVVTKKYYPQGLFNSLLQDEDKSKYIIAADVNDLFFETIGIQVKAPEASTYEKYGLQSTQFAAKYPDRDIASLVFDKMKTADQSIQFPINTKLDLLYSYQVQYTFLPDSGWEGERMSYEIPWQPTEDRTPTLIPHEYIGFLDINVSLERSFFWNRIQSVEVHLSYQSLPPSKWKKEKVLQFNPDSDTEQHWKLRLNAPTANPIYTYYFVYALEDGSQRKTEPVTSNVPGIAVPDLTRAKPVIRFQPQLKAGEQLYLDLNYEDAANNYRWEKSLEITTGTPKPVVVEIPLMNPARREFSYTYTLLSADGIPSKKSFPTAIYTSPIVIKSIEKGSLEVQVISDEVDWDAVRLVTVDLLYQDTPNNIQKSASQTFKKYDPTFVWKVETADQSLTNYQWKAIFYMRNKAVGSAGEVYYPAAKGKWETASTKLLLLDQFQPKETKLEVEVSGEDIDWDLVKKVDISLRYRDRANGIDESVPNKTFDGRNTSFLWQVKLADDSPKEYEWKAKFDMVKGRDPSFSWRKETSDRIDLKEVLDALLK